MSSTGSKFGDVGFKGLSGVKVLDLGRYIAAPLCAAMLADQGADVVRIEPPSGATDRDVMPLDEPGRGALFLQMNRNKRSLTLDTTTPEGRRIFEKLVAESDVVVVNMPPRAIKKLGYDYDTLRAIRSDIIVTTVTAFSYDGADRDRVGFDGTGQAMSGSMMLTGTGEMPMRAAVSYVDYSTGMAAAFATVSALYERLQTGRGQHVSASLMGAAMTVMNPILIEEATGVRRRDAIGNRSPIAGPSDLFAAKDGWVMVQVIGDVMFGRWVDLVKRPELLNDPSYDSDIKRGENGEALSAIMATWCAERTVDECLVQLEAARLPGCKALAPADTIKTSSFPDYMQFVSVESSAHDVPIATGALHTLASDHMGVTAAPTLGQHTDQILQGLGYGSDAIAQLRKSGVA